METAGKSEDRHLVNDDEFRKLLKEAEDKEARGLVPLDVDDVPGALLEEFDKIVAKAYPGGRSEAIRDLILQEIHRRKGTDKFYDGVKWNIPRSCFILFALPQTECRKLEQWQKSKDRIITHIGPNGEILLLNEWRLDEFTRRKQPKQNEKKP